MIDSELGAALRAWERAPRPFENFRAHRADAPTYAVECDLDHQASYVAAMAEAFAARSPHWDFALRADAEREELASLAAALRAVRGAPADATAALDGYMAATERLLRAIRAEAVARSGGPAD